MDGNARSRKTQNKRLADIIPLLDLDEDIILL